MRRKTRKRGEEKYLILCFLCRIKGGEINFPVDIAVDFLALIPYPMHPRRKGETRHYSQTAIIMANLYYLVAPSLLSECTFRFNDVSS